MRWPASACLEPGAGSDVASIKTSARSDGDDYVINGGKMWITNGVQADWICLLANTSDGQVHRNKSLICVPMKSKGVQVARKLDKMGMRSSDTAQIFFDNVRVPKRNRIGEEGKGFTYQMVQFQEERLWGAAACLKAHEFIIAETIEYTRNRKAFGKIDPRQPDRPFQARGNADRSRAVARADLSRRRGAGRGRGRDAARHHGQAARPGGLGRELTDACLQFWGGMGFMNETPVSRAYRDSRLTSIGGGADEVMLTVLCKMMGTLPKANKSRSEMRERLMITLYHCDGARSFRPLWMLEELGLPYELKMLPFPPRVFAKEYLAINPLGTIPFMVDGETKMTESSGICHYLGTKYGPTPLVVGAGRSGLWRVPELDVFQRRHADLSANAGAEIQPARAGGTAQPAGGRRLRQMVPRPAAGGRGRHRRMPETLVRRPVHRGRYRQRLCAAAGRQYRARQGFSGPMSRLTGPRLQERDGYKRAVAAERKAGVEQNVAPRVRA